MNSLRFAAASAAEQAVATGPVPGNVLDLLRDTLVDSWEHAKSFAAGHRHKPIARVLTSAEWDAIAPIVEEVQGADPDQAGIAPFMDALRPKAHAVVDRLNWRGPLDPRIFPGACCPHSG